MVAGLLLASVLFLINDMVFVTQGVNGLWHCSLTVEETSYPLSMGMITGHVVVLQSDGRRVRGAIERVSETIPPNATFWYSQSNIMHGTIEGYHETRLVFMRSRNRMQLVVQFQSGNRLPTYFLSLNDRGKESLAGKYAATVAQGEKGSVQCHREALAQE